MQERNKRYKRWNNSDRKNISPSLIRLKVKYNKWNNILLILSEDILHSDNIASIPLVQEQDLTRSVIKVM